MSREVTLSGVHLFQNAFFVILHTSRVYDKKPGLLK